MRLQGFVLDPNLTYYFQVKGDSDGAGGMRVHDAVVLFQAAKFFGEEDDLYSFGVGQFKHWFLHQERNSSKYFQMVERSLSNEFFNVGRGIGMLAQGYLRPVFYAFTVTNGFNSYNTPVSGVDQIE